MATVTTRSPGLGRVGRWEFAALQSIVADLQVWHLFDSGQTGAIYDISDISTLFQDEAGTTPVTASGQSVRRVNDKSGNGNNLTIDNDAYRPVYTTGSGYAWLAFDGTNDRLKSVFSITQPFYRISALSQESWTLYDTIYGSGDVSNAGIVFQVAATPEMTVHAGAGLKVAPSLALGVPGVLTEHHNGASSRVALNNGAYVTGNIGTTSPGGVTVGASDAGVDPANIKFYGMIMRGGSMSDIEIAAARLWAANRSGVTL